MSLDIYFQPSKCEHCNRSDSAINFNITHNLGLMAKKCGAYNHLWRPDEIGVTKASELIEPLELALASLQDKPDYYRSFDSPNGYGVYTDFVQFVSDVLTHCKARPDDNVSVWR